MRLDREKQDTRVFNRYFVLIWFASLGVNLCQNVLNQTVSLFVTASGLSTGFAGFLAIPYAVMAMLMRFVGGAWIDARSRRSLLLIGCFVFSVTTILFGALPTAFFLIVFRALHGFAYSSAQLAASTMNVDVTPPKKSKLGIGLFWVSSAASLCFSGYIVTGLSADGTYGKVIAAAAMMALAGGVLALLCNYEKKAPETALRPGTEDPAPEYKGLLRFVEPSVYKPAILFFLMSAGISSASLYIIMFAKQMQYSHAGLVLVLATVGMTMGNLLSERLSEALGASRTLVLAFGIGVAGFAAMALWPHMGTFLLGGWAYGMVQGICMPVLYYLTIHKLPAHRRGVAGGTSYCMVDLGVGLGAYFWGLMIDWSGFSAMYLVSAGVLLLGLALSIVFFRGEEARHGEQRDHP